MELTQSATAPDTAATSADVWAGVPIAGHIFRKDGRTRKRLGYIEPEQAMPLHQLQDEYDLSGKVLIRTVVDGEVQDLTIDVGTTGDEEEAEDSGLDITEAQLEQIKQREREAGREEQKEQTARDRKALERKVEDLERDLRDMKSDEKRQRNRANTLRERLDNEIDERQRKVRTLRQEHEQEIRSLRNERDELQRKVMRLETGKSQGQEFLGKLVEQLPQIMQGYMQQKNAAQAPQASGGQQLPASNPQQAPESPVNDTQNDTPQAQQQVSGEEIQQLRAEAQQQAIKSALRVAEGEATPEQLAAGIQSLQEQLRPMVEFDLRMWVKIALGLAHDGLQRDIDPETMALTIRPVVTQYAPEGSGPATLLKNMPASAALQMLKKQVDANVSADLEAYVTDILAALKSTL